MVPIMLSTDVGAKWSTVRTIDNSQHINHKDPNTFESLISFGRFQVYIHLRLVSNSFATLYKLFEKTRTDLSMMLAFLGDQMFVNYRKDALASVAYGDIRSRNNDPLTT